jgi:Intraflagellar transport protein 43
LKAILRIMDKKGDDSKGQDKDEGRAKAPRRRERHDVSSSSEGKYQSESVNEAMQNNPTEATKTRRKRGGAEGSEGGWMTMSDPKSSNSAVGEVQEPEVVPQATNKNKHFEENNDEIMIIPDLEEDGNENDQRIAHAPRVVRKIPTLAELESDVKATTPTMDSGFDLGVLLTTLVPVSLVVEEDVPWTFENLLRDVTDELLAPNKMVAPGAPKEATKDKEKASKTKDKEKEKEKDKHKEKSGDKHKEGVRK